jgi:prophage regulatory protein
LYYMKDELPEVTGLSMSTIDEQIRQDEFPKPRKLSAKRVGWLDTDLRAWAQERPVSDLPPPPNTGAKKPRRAGAAGQAVRA